MYAKLFAQMYQGSMVGAGANVFALWPYCLANANSKGYVEINPMLVAFQIGCTPEEMQAALDYLCAPDPKSRSDAEEGRRLVREGQFLFRVVNHAYYRAILDEEARRDYQREWDRKHRSSGHARAKAPEGQSDTVRHSLTSPTESDKSDTYRSRSRSSTSGGSANGQKAVALFVSGWKGIYGEDPSRPAVSAASKGLAALLSQHGDAVFRAGLDTFFGTKNGFVGRNRHDPGYFVRHFDEFSVTR